MDEITIYKVDLLFLSTYNGEYFRRRYAVQETSPTMALNKAIDAAEEDHKGSYPTSELVFQNATVTIHEEIQRL